MRKGLIAIDVDGTLVGPSLLLRPYTKEVLSSLAEEGFTIVLSSGRPWRSLAPYYEELGLKTPVITYNGAHAFDPKDRSFEERRLPFPKEEIQNVVEEILPYAESVFVDEGERALLNRLDLYIDTYFPYLEGDHVIQEPFPEIRKDPFVLLFKRKLNQDEPYKKAIERYLPLRYRAWRESPYAEAYYEGVDKGSALSYVMGKLGFSKKETIAIGDSDNDYPMLVTAGHGYRMPESRQKVLLPFPCCPDTAENEGVAKLLASLCLK